MTSHPTEGGENQGGGASGKPDRATAASAVEPVPVSSEAGIPSAVSVAEMQIGSVTMRVYHLDNGQRVIDADSVAAFMAALEDGTLLLTEADSMKLAKVVLG